jgi:hypothetical protein
MRRILLSCAILGVLTLPAAAASARAQQAAAPGFIVLKDAANDGGSTGRPLTTLVVHGFVLGSVKQKGEARVDIYQLPSKGGEGAPTAAPPDAAQPKPIRWHGLPGREFRGTGFRFRALGGYYRVVIRGSGVYLYAGGQGHVTLRGSSFDPSSDGTYSIDGRAFRSLPSRVLKRQIGGA